MVEADFIPFESEHVDHSVLSEAGVTLILHLGIVLLNHDFDENNIKRRASSSTNSTIHNNTSPPSFKHRGTVLVVSPSLVVSPLLFVSLHLVDSPQLVVSTLPLTLVVRLGV